MSQGFKFTVALSCLYGLCGLLNSAHGGEILQLNRLDLPGHSQPSITVDRRGGFILTSIERHDDEAQLRFHRLNRQGTVLDSGLIARGKDWFVNWADFPSLVVADNGDWLSFFLRKSDPSQPYAYDIWITRSTDRGRQWSTPEKLHDDALPTEHGFVSLLPDGDDRVLAVWLDGRRGARSNAEQATHGHDAHGGAHTSLRSAVLRRGQPPAQQAELDTLTCDCCTTDALHTRNGPLVAYRNRSEAEVRDIGWVERQAGDWSGPAIAIEDGWQIAGCPVNGPALSTLDKRPLLAWPTQNGANFELRLALRREGEWHALPTLESHPDLMGRVDAVSWGDQGALISWLGVASQATPPHPVLRVAHLNAGGKELSRVEVTDLSAGRNTGMPRMASLGNVAILVWTEPSAGQSRIRGARITIGSQRPAP